MKIGLVSNPDYCKAHVVGLSWDGHEVDVLGGDEISIPPTTDIVILRPESVSHSASDAAIKWGRDTRKPLIIHNGLTGIRRELEKYCPRPRSTDYQKILSTLRKDRPGDSPQQYREVLSAMGAPMSMVDELVPDPDRWSGDLNMSEYPLDAPWVRALPLERLSREYSAAQEIFNSTTAAFREEVKNLFLTACEKKASHGYFPITAPIAASLKGKPTRFFLFLLKCLPKDQIVSRTGLALAYDNLCSRGTDTRLAEGAAWAVGRQISSPTRKKLMDPQDQIQTDEILVQEEAVAEVVDDVLAKVDLCVSVPDSYSDLEKLSRQMGVMRAENETHILELMDSVTDLRKENHTLRTALEALSVEVKNLRNSPRGGSDTILDALDTLKARGAKITIEI